MQFGGLFWNTFKGFPQTNTFDLLFEKPSVTLSEVLENDNTIQELKNQNPKLVSFLTTEKIKELIDLIILYPPEDSDNTRGCKLPFTASEMFSCESSILIDCFITDQTLLDHFLSFLSIQPIPPILAGYFSKLAITLISKKPVEIITKMHSAGSLIQIVQNLKTKSFADIVAKILLQESQELFFLLGVRKELLFLVVTQLGSDETSSFFAAEVVTELIEKFETTNSWFSLVESLTREKTLEALLKVMSSSVPHQMTGVLKVLNSLIKNIKCEELLRPMDPDDSSMDLDKEPESSDFLLEVLEFSERMVQELKKNPESFQSTKKEVLIKALGEHRLKIVEFFSNLIKINIKEIEEFFEKNSLIEVCFQVFFTFEQNSMLHHQVFQLATNAITRKGKRNCYIQQLLDSPIIESLTVGYKDKPFIGYLVKILNLIEEESQKLEIIRLKLENSAKWKEFSESLREVNEKFKKQLGEKRPDGTNQTGFDCSMPLNVPDPQVPVFNSASSGFGHFAPPFSNVATPPVPFSAQSLPFKVPPFPSPPLPSPPLQGFSRPFPISQDQGNYMTTEVTSEHPGSTESVPELDVATEENLRSDSQVSTNPQYRIQEENIKEREANSSENTEKELMSKYWNFGK